ncbi:Mis12-Mtw1 protein family-domain-containing protein [Geopyxis carbonaria]|nr:Mis12-Mtw1 protein family-domain-containing protein [Geopyxis carbonaria]
MNNDDGFEFKVRKSKRLSERISPVVTTSDQGPQLSAAESSAANKSSPAKSRVRVQRKRHASQDAELQPTSKTRMAAKREKTVKYDKSAVEDRKVSPMRIPTSRVDAPISGGDTSKVKLPTSDTPINRKNQKYRQSFANGRRRSSVGMRGRRASSMMVDGVVAEPHAEILHQDFYKHIQGDQLENMRMRQLLSWCGHRALASLQGSSEVKPANDLDGSARNIARVIEEELLKEITTNGQLSTWFTRDSSPPPTVVKKPNPRNVENLAKLEQLKADLQKLEQERQSWRMLQQLEPQQPLPRDTLLRPEEFAFADSLPESQEIVGAARRIVKQQGADIEFQVDRLADGAHKVQQYGNAADRLAGQILEGVENTLASGDTRLKQASGTDGLPLQEVLRSLSRVGRNE